MMSTLLSNRYGTIGTMSSISSWSSSAQHWNRSGPGSRAEHSSTLSSTEGTSVTSLPQPGPAQSAWWELASLHLLYIVPRSSCLTSSVKPIGLRNCCSSADCSGYGSSRSVIVRMFSHTGSSQTPSPSVSYFEFFISSLALSTSPDALGVAYGS